MAGPRVPCPPAGQLELSRVVVAGFQRQEWKRAWLHATEVRICIALHWPKHVPRPTQISGLRGREEVVAFGPYRKLTQKVSYASRTQSRLKEKWKLN